MNMPKYDWGFTSEPEPFLNGRRLACPRGKVIGGSSSINGMVYVRGHAFDYDTWSEICLLYTSPSPRDATLSRMPSSA